jgi:hypothetical protein
MKVWKKNINSKNLLKKKNNQKNDDQIWYKKIKHDEIAKKQLKTILDIYINKVTGKKMKNKKIQ